MKETSMFDVLEFIKEAHSGQYYGDLPYWTHPAEVAVKGRLIFADRFDSSCNVAALCHDVVEDTAYSLDDLLGLGLSEVEVAAISLVTKVKGLTYAENIQRIIDSGDVRAMMVKYADNHVNYNGDKSGWSPARAAKANANYAWSMNALGAVLGVKCDY
jgi:(p)ppGpp synthase/HD superfamily hydrolase